MAETASIIAGPEIAPEAPEGPLTRDISGFLYRAGWAPKRIARHYGASPKTVARHIQRLGLHKTEGAPASHRMAWTEEEHRSLRNCLAYGVAPARAAMHLGRTIEAVKNEARRIGRPFPNGNETARTLDPPPATADNDARHVAACRAEGGFPTAVIGPDGSATWRAADGRLWQHRMAWRNPGAAGPAQRRKVAA